MSMTIDKQALRKVAEKATPGNWRRSSSRFNGITVQWHHGNAVFSVR